MRPWIIVKLLIFLALYYTIKYLGGTYGQYILYGINQMVTFLHEFGHAAGAVITGGGVEALQINQDGSGFTMTRGGSRGVILLGGYIGSAIFGNVLFFIGALRQKWAGICLHILASMMVFSAIFWFNSMFTSSLLIGFAILLVVISRFKSIRDEVVMFFGVATVMYIIEDFNVGPSSDLQQYAEIFYIIPAAVWMYIWLAIVLILSIWNVYIVIRSGKKDKPNEAISNDKTLK